ncbi:MAG: DUF5667 domain-containing protein [Candidatus Diapherotrites archaeon]|nr:DUF5667 domain-containing protein [Candidatus Diapherotrites archaeon]
MKFANASILLVFLIAFSFTGLAQEGVLVQETSIESNASIETELDLDSLPKLEGNLDSLPGTEVISGSGGIGPGHFLYGLDKAFDKVSLALTFNKHAKAKKALLIARERFLEAKTAADEGNDAGAEEALTEAETMESEAELAVDLVPVEESLNSESIQVTETLSLEADLAEHVSIRAMVLQRVKEKLANRSGKGAIAIERVLVKLSDLENKFEARKQALQEKFEIKRERLKQVLQAKTGKTVDEIETELEGVRNKKELFSKLKQGSVVRSNRAKAFLVLTKQRLRSALVTDSETLSEIESLISETETTVSDVSSSETETSAEVEIEAEVSADASELADKINSFVLEVNAIRKRCSSLEGLEQETCLQELTQKKKELKEEIRERHIRVLERVLEKVPVQAKSALTQVVQRAKTRLENLDQNKFSPKLRALVAQTLERRAQRVSEKAERIENRGEKVSDRLTVRADNLREEGQETAADRLDSVIDRVDERTETRADRLNERAENLRNRAGTVLPR